jgi:hypothetical protein
LKAVAFELVFDIILINVILLIVLKFPELVHEITRKSLTRNSQNTTYEKNM